MDHQTDPTIADDDEATHILADVACEVDAELADMTERLGQELVGANLLHFRRVAALRVFMAARLEGAQAAA